MLDALRLAFDGLAPLSLSWMPLLLVSVRKKAPSR